MWHGWKKARVQEEKDMDNMMNNLGTFAQDQRLQACRDKRHQDKIDREVLKRIRQQEHATAVAAGERSAYTPSLIYANIMGMDSNNMPMSQEVADAVSPTEPETDNIMETRYKNKKYADSQKETT